MDRQHYMTMKEFMHMLTFVANTTWEREGKGHPSDLWGNVSMAGDSIALAFEYLIMKESK